MGRRLLTILLLTTILILALSSSLFAGREWAPGMKGKSGSTKEAGTSNMWLRMGLSRGSFSYDESEYFDHTKMGLSLEIGVQPVAAAPDATVQWALEIPIVLTAHMREFDFDNFLVAIQMIPTARVTYTTESGLAISPSIGYGGGLSGHEAFYVESPFGSGSFGGTFDMVWSLRLGADVMLNKSFGFNFYYTSTSLTASDEFDVWGPGGVYLGQESLDLDFSFSQISAGIVYHP